MQKCLAVVVMLVMGLVPGLAVAGGGGRGGNNDQDQSQGQGQNQGQYQGQSQGQGQSQSSSNRNTNMNQNRNTAVGVGVGVGIGTGGKAEQSQSQGNVQSTSVDASSGDYPRQAPPAFAPNLVAAPETCMGSTAVGASTPFGGVSIGTTYKSTDCELRMFARTLMSLGQGEAALALLAQNPKVAEALRAVGTKAAWLLQEKDLSPAPVAQVKPLAATASVSTFQGP